jgi:hypothetical protein
VYADTGVFFSTDARTRRAPSAAFITYASGYRMWEQPVSAANIGPILNTSAPFFAHTQWDYDQIVAYGIANSQGNASRNSGGGNTPRGYGSPVAGPQTWYAYEATDTVADPPLAQWNTTDPDDWSGIRFNNTVGPWARVLSPGSLIGTGSASGDGTMRRTVADASSLGFDVRPANPLPSNTTALRIALGELRAGDIGAVEVALRVLATPIDGIHMADVNCGESFGGGAAAGSPSGTGNSGKSQPWGFVVPSPACVYLNNPVRSECRSCARSRRSDVDLYAARSKPLDPSANERRGHAGLRQQPCELRFGNRRADVDDVWLACVHSVEPRRARSG